MEKSELLEEGSVGREEECIVLIHVRRNVLTRNKVYRTHFRSYKTTMRSKLA